MAHGAEWQTKNGIETLHLTALEAEGPVQAFFTGRRGGASQRWDGGLNWSYLVGDEADKVRENRRRTLALLGLQPADAVMAGLVHGNRVVAVGPGGRAGEGVGPGHPASLAVGEAVGRAVAEVLPEAALHPAPPTVELRRTGPDEVALVPDCDALITDQRRLALIVTAADCVPVFLYDPVRRCIGVAHAGWRGTVAGIAGRTVAAMAQQYGSRPQDIVAAVGPSIGPCCYEVGEQVAEPVRGFYGAKAAQLLKPHGPGKYLLDLWEANRQDLLQAGVGRITVADSCTACLPDRLFSHRAEAGKAGRGAAVMALA
ncbi:MAG: peptidoglycan editing factor PgeF [Mycobacterium leprae]